MRSSGSVDRRPDSSPENRPGISIVIPLYNSAAILPLLVGEIERFLESQRLVAELILVNDGSRDRSWETACELAAERHWIRPINLMRNYGQQSALLCGIRAASFPITVTIDDDLQHPPTEIPKLLEKLDSGCDVVYGVPATETHGFLRDCASRLTKLTLQSAMGVEAARNVSAFRAFRTSVRDAFCDYHGTFVSIDVLLTWGTMRFDAVTVRHEPRESGASQYTFRRLVSHALNITTGFSVLPLRFASIVGFAFTLFGILVLAWVAGRYLMEGGSVPGFPFLASIIALFSGAQLFALGIIGEYLARIHFRSMDRPPYVVREDRPGAEFEKTSLSA